MKKCSKCLVIKKRDAFYSNKSQSDGLCYYCKVCHNTYNKARYKKNNNVKKWHNHYSREWAKNNPENIREAQRKYQRKCREGDINYRIISNLRTKLWKCVRGKVTDSKTILGVGLDEFKKYIMACETWDIMWTWEDYGIKWNIDHIIPVSKWYLKWQSPEEAFHYTNCQPMCPKENLRKGNKINDQDI
jgi:hypothetical protein